MTASRGLPNTEVSILVVDANGRDAALLGAFCRRDGYRVLQTDDAIDAMNTLEADRTIGIVAVTVVATARPDGLALIERLRRCAARPVQFIVVSRTGGTDDIIRAMHLQVADFVTDPEDERRLELALSRGLDALRNARTAPHRSGPATVADQPSGLDVLEEAYRHGLALIERVEALRGEAAGSREAPRMPALFLSPERGVAKGARKPGADGQDGERLAKLLAMQKTRAVRSNFFAQGLFDDPCWDMLLDLMINRLQGRRISVSSLCIASGVAQTTALRRINDLHKSGLVRRSADESDGRRVFIELTDQGVAAMVRYVDSI